MIVVLARWTAKGEFSPFVLKAMIELQKATRLEPGNLAYDLFQDPQAPEKFLIYEAYKDAEAVEAHRTSPHFQDIVVNQIVPKLLERTGEVFEK